MDRFPQLAKFPGLNILAKPIHALCNLSISQGVQMLAKLQNWSLFLKRGKLILSTRASFIAFINFKIIETVIHDQINTCLSDEDTLNNYQSGFQGNHLTNLCLDFLTDKNEILLQKLKGIRFSESTIKWFKSYLSEKIFL